MKPQSNRPVVRTAAGNIEERAAQIQCIKERLERLGGNANQVAAELVALARKIKALTGYKDQSVAAPTRKQDN